MSDRFAGLKEALRKYLAKPRGEDSEPEGKAVSEEMNKALPDALSARSAIEEDRRRKKKLIDDLARD